MLFRSQSDDEYIPRTIVDKATVPCSYIIEAQGKHHPKTREHLRPIHINLPSPKTHKSHPPNPKPLPSCIPKPNSQSKYTSQPKTLTPVPIHVPPIFIPRPKQPSKPTHSANTAPSVKDLLQHLSSIDAFPSVIATPQEFKLASGPQPGLTPTATPEEIAVESPHHSVTYLQSLTMSQVLPATHALQYPVHHTPCGQATHNPQQNSLEPPAPQVGTLNLVSIPLPSSDHEAEASDTPAEVKADSPHSNQDESPTSRPRARLTPMTRGGVNNEIPDTELHPQTSGGVTNV